MWPSGGLDFNLGLNSWVISNPIKVDVVGYSICQDLNCTCEAFCVYHCLAFIVYYKLLLEQWAGNSIPSWAPLVINVTFRELRFQFGPKNLGNIEPNQGWCGRWFNTSRPQLHLSDIDCISQITSGTVSRSFHIFLGTLVRKCVLLVSQISIWAQSPG